MLIIKYDNYRKCKSAEEIEQALCLSSDAEELAKRADRFCVPLDELRSRVAETMFEMKRDFRL